MTESLASGRLFSLIQKTWDCYVHTPLAYATDGCIDESLMDNLSWFVATAMMPSHNTILLGIDPGLALQLTSNMFGKPEPAVEDADIIDAVGEISNIIAGSVKTEFALEDSMESPQLINKPALVDLLAHYSIETEVLALSTNRPFYTALISHARH